MLYNIIFNGILTSPFTIAKGLTWSLMGLKLSQPFRYLVIEISSATFPFLDLNSTSLSHFPYTVSWEEERSQCLCSYCQTFSDLLERHPFWSERPIFWKWCSRITLSRWEIIFSIGWPNKVNAFKRPTIGIVFVFSTVSVGTRRAEMIPLLRFSTFRGSSSSGYSLTFVPSWMLNFSSFLHPRKTTLVWNHIKATQWRMCYQ